MMDDEVVDERQKYVDNLKAQLKDITAGQSFEKTKAGELITKILQADVNRFTNDVLSDKFVDDHSGYIDTRAKANYAASLLNRLLSLKNPKREKEIRDNIKEATEEPGI